MVTIGMNYRVRVRPGKERVFEDAFERVLAALREARGHAASRLYRSVGDEAQEYLIISRWDSEAAFEEFVRSEQFRKVTSWGTDHVLESPPRHVTYHEAAVA
jgi:heme-degrading monooxygenase HmoA